MFLVGEDQSLRVHCRICSLVPDTTRPGKVVEVPKITRRTRLVVAQVNLL